MKRVFLACAGLVALAGSAAAADLPPGPAPYYKAPPTYAPYSWTGFYIGRERRRRLRPVDLGIGRVFRSFRRPRRRHRRLQLPDRPGGARRRGRHRLERHQGHQHHGHLPARLHDRQLLAFHGARTRRLRGRPVHALRDRRRRVRQHQRLFAWACRRQHDQRRLDRGRRHRVRDHRPLDAPRPNTCSSISASSIAVPIAAAASSTTCRSPPTSCAPASTTGSNSRPAQQGATCKKPRGALPRGFSFAVRTRIHTVAAVAE